jgi:hypothetical protein
MPKKNINKDLLDSLAKDLGEVVKEEEKGYVVLEGEARDKYVDESLSAMTEKPTLAYNEGVPCREPTSAICSTVSQQSMSRTL